MKRNFLIFAGIFAFCAIFFASCSDLVNDLEGTKTVKTEDTYKPAEVTSVPAETVAERTATVTIGSTEYTLNFDETGKSGTVKLADGTSKGTFSYDSTVLKMSVDGVGETYLRNVNGTYYLLDVNRLENSSGSGLVGKWVWKNGTPSDFYDYYYFYANGIFQNPKYEANGYTGVTWKATEGMVTLYDEDGNVCKEANGVPSVCIYDGTYLYPKCYLLTLGKSGTSGSGVNDNSGSGGTGGGSGSTGDGDSSNGTNGSSGSENGGSSEGGNGSDSDSVTGGSGGDNENAGSGANDNGGSESGVVGGGNGNSGSGGTGGGSGSTGDGDSGGTGNETDSSRITGSVMISEDGISHGSGIAAGETVTVTITPDEGYSLGSFSVTDGNGQSLTTTEVTAGTKYTFIMPESPVTISARFEKLTLAYIGTKAPTEAKEVGDIVFNDGSATPYTSDLTLTAEQKAKAVAVIFYAGTEEPTVGSNENILGKKTLGVGIKKSYYLKWCLETANGYDKIISSILCTKKDTQPTENELYYRGSEYRYYNGGSRRERVSFYISGDFDGSDNWNALKMALGADDDTNIKGNYPAWEWVNNYANDNNLSGEYANGWYLPTIVELRMLEFKFIYLDEALKTCGGEFFNDSEYNRYSSSSQGESTKNTYYDEYSIASGRSIPVADKSLGGGGKVIAIRAF